MYQILCKKYPYNLSKKSFDRHRFAANLCKQVYNTKSGILIKKYKNHTYISLEGSYTIFHWIYNFCVFKSNDIHTGFYNNTQKYIEAYRLKELIETNDNVILCGHSFGAAAALLISHQLKETRNIKEIVIFGCPMISGQDFKREFQEKNNINIFSYQNGTDIICSLPFSFFGYVPLIDDVFHLESVSDKDGLVKSIYDHSMLSYVLSLSFPLESKWEEKIDEIFSFNDENTI
tara:strand:- start:2630 stop:3325 length:696 start_codon:yes stop_codon:yes gene_type:complete